MIWQTLFFEKSKKNLMLSGDNLQEMANPIFWNIYTNCMKWQTPFPGKSKKNILSLLVDNLHKMANPIFLGKVRKISSVY